jgi:Secretion system C-terminal sorting domain
VSWHTYRLAKSGEFCLYYTSEVKKGKVILLNVTALIIIIIATQKTTAQSVGNYSVSRTTGITYNSIIATGNSFASWRYTGGFSEDDNRSESTNIGFDFWYNGQRYTQFSVSTNGFIDFSSSTDDGGPTCDAYGYCNDFFTDSKAGTYIALAPFYDDMTTGSGIDPLGTSIKYQVSGTSPNRVLTVEWDAMAVYQNTSPDINFQVKLHETTGVIDYVYETMNSGTNTFSYTIGINTSSMSNSPKTDELLSQQTANSSNFSNSEQNNLSIMPTSNSQLSFIPLTPAVPSGTLTFTAITGSTIDLNWVDWANNEVGYVIYHSTDDINYFFNTQTAADAITANVIGLTPNTTYYFRLYAVTEGELSTALTGNATTLSPGTVTSVQTGRWDRTTTWDCGCIPSAGDNVIIQDGHRVTMRSNGLSCNDLTIGQGTSGELRYNRNIARDLTVNGNIIINSGATFYVDAANSNATHTLNIKGNITNSGTLDFQTDVNSLCVTNFIKQDGNQSVSGSGVSTNFYTLFVDKSLMTNILDISVSNFTCDIDALNYTSGGTFKFSSSGTNNFSLFSTIKDIPSDGKIWMTSANSTMNFGASINLRGDLLIDAGTVIIGDAADENIISFGGLFEINGGAVNIAGRYDRNNTESTSKFTQTGGTLTLATIGSTSTTQSPFGMDVIGSSLQLSGGTIILQQEGGSGIENLGFNTSGVNISTITGGSLQIGNASTPAAQILQINSTSRVGNIFINSANATAQLVTNNVNVISNVTLTAGNFDANGLDITVGGDWLAKGGSFTASVLSTVTLNGSNQSITSGGSAFNNLTLSGSGNKSFQDNLVVNADLLINAAMIAINNGFTASIGGNWINNSSFGRNGETITFNGSTDQNIAGSATNDFTNITINKTGGSVINESNLNLYQTLDIQSGTSFDADGASGTSNFSMISNASEESRINSLPAGASITGTIRAEKYLPVYGSKRWRNIGFPVSGASVSDLQNEIPISGTFTGSDNGIGGIPANASGSLAYYDNTIGSVAETLDDRWVLYPTTDNNALLTTAGTEARGYSIWVRDVGAVTFDVTGTVNQGSINFNPTGSFERWNLMGNPYPSTINWDAAGWTKAGIQGNTIQVWDGLQYQTWNGTLGSMGDGLIAKGQAFFIEGSQASMTLTATETVKDVTTGTTYRTNGDEPQFLELLITDNTYTDKAYIHFVSGAENAYDAQDAGKLLNYIFSFSSLSSDSVQLSINAIDVNSCNMTIPLAIEYIWAGSYKLKWNNLSSLPKHLLLGLNDNYTGKTYNLRGVNSFEFEINSAPESKNKYRFSLVIGSKEIDRSVIAQGRQICNSSSALISIDNAQNGIEYTLMNDANVIDSYLGNGELLEIEVDSTRLKLGSNLFSLKAKACSVVDLNSFEVTMIAKPIIAFNETTNTLTTSYQENLVWFRNTSQVETVADTILNLGANKTAEYRVKVTNQLCYLTSEPFVITSLEPGDAKTNLGIQVYPNPIAEHFTIVANSNAVPPINMQLLDASGKLVMDIGVVQSLMRVNVGNLGAGIYFLQLTYPTKIETIRLIK